MVRVSWLARLAANLNHRFQFNKRGQLFIRSRNETLSVVAMRSSNPDRSPVGINRCDTAPTPSGFAEIIGDLANIDATTNANNANGARLTAGFFNRLSARGKELKRLSRARCL
jgi:hypothetical protein